ncbi:putative transferase [Rosa chinensis]|uniref:Putative transferase n=1 Tax=Rosa chinensis TaxID=74649 RepID=A0A2P6SNY1_ROSCH|nr:putative transferase [Rosa chinensis]
MEDHVIVPNMNSDMEDADQFVRDYISRLTTTPLDLSKLLWESSMSTKPLMQKLLQ